MRTTLPLLLLAALASGCGKPPADPGADAASGSLDSGGPEADAARAPADAGADAGAGAPDAAPAAWARGYHGDLEVDAVGADGFGAVYSGGYFVGAADFGDGHRLKSVVDDTGASTKDLFVAKHLPTGQLAWVRHFGGAGLEGNVYDLVASADGASYLSGAFSGTVDLDGRVLVATASAGSGSASSGTYGNMVLAALDAAGATQWALQATGDRVSGGNEVALGPGGSIAQVGMFGGTKAAGGSMTIDGQTLPFDGGYFDTYVALFSADGKLAWLKHVGGAGAQRGKGIDVDAAGNVLVVGDAWSGATEFAAGQSFTVAGDETTQDFWLAKYDPRGNLLWFESFGSAGRDEVKGVGAKSSGEVVVAAGFDGPSIAVLDRVLTGSPPPHGATGLLFGLAADGKSVTFTNTIASVVKCCEIEVDARDHTFAGLGAAAPAVRFGDRSSASVGGLAQGGLLVDFDAQGAASATWTFDTDGGSFGELALLPAGQVAVSAAYEGRLVWGDTRLEGDPNRAQALVVTPPRP